MHGHLEKTPSNVALRARALQQRDEIRLCAITKAELLFGAYKSSRQFENLNLLRQLFGRFASIDFDDASADTYGRIRADLARKGTPIGPNDLMIAAIAVVHSLTLVTNNTREFSRVAGLRIEDWRAGESKMEQ